MLQRNGLIQILDINVAGNIEKAAKQCEQQKQSRSPLQIFSVYGVVAANLKQMQSSSLVANIKIISKDLPDCKFCPAAAW